MNIPKSIKWFSFCTVLFLSLYCSAQCPTVNDTSQSFCDIESLFVSDLQANDEGAGIAWFDSPIATVPLSGSVSLINGATYYLDNAAGNCGSRIAVSVSIIGPPTGLNFQGVCVENPNEATLADLEAFGNDVRWYSSPSSGVALDLTTILTDNTIYYADQANPETGCRTSRLAVLVNVGIVPVPIGNSVQQFCVGIDLTPTIADLVASGNNLWYPSFSSASPLDPSTPLVDGEVYYATIIDPPCESTNRLEVQVELINQISAGTDGTLDICLGDTSTFDLFNSLGGTPDTGGTWSPALVSGTGLFDPAVDTAGTYTYTVNSTNVVCPDASATVTVTIVPPPNAGTDGTLDICLGDTTTFDLFNSLGGTPDTGGTWSPALDSGTGLFNPAVDTAGTYTYTVSSPNSTCPDASAAVTVSFLDPPNAGTDGTLDICLGDTSTFDLFNSLGGTPDTGGTWSPALVSGTGLFDPAVDTAGTYTYTVNSTNVVCPDASATVTVTIVPPPNAGTDGTLDICLGDTTTFDLFNSLGGTPDTGGTWSPALDSGTGLFNPAVDTAGTYTYTVSSPNSTCPDASAAVTVSFLDPPNAGTDGTLDICLGDTSTFDLFNSLGGTPDTGGTWSPALVSGTGLFDPAVDTAGTYTYTVNSTNVVCPDASATVTVTIVPPPNAGTDGTLDICLGDTTTFDLFNSLGGTPDTGGTWSPALDSGTGLFNPAVDTAGIYTYTVSSPNSTCPDASAAVTVSFLDPPNAGTDGTLDICLGDTSTFDLFNSLGGTPDTGGTWSPALVSGTGLFDPAVDTAGTYTYTVNSTNVVCPDASATVTVTIVPPPNASTDGTLDICLGDTTTFDLFNSLGGTPDTGGTWSPALDSGTGLFNPAVDTAGIYTYTVSSPNSTCPDASAAVTVSFLDPPNAGTDGTLDICLGDTSTFDLFNSLGGTPDTGGTWSPALVSGTGLFDPAVDTAGTYTYTVNSTNVVCPDASATVTVTIVPPPNAGTDGTLDICLGDTTTFDLFNSLGGTPDTGGTWSPALDSGTGLFNPAVDTAGTYTYTVSSPNSTCPDASAAVTVSFLDPPNAGTDGTLDICLGDTSTFDLFNSLGGTPDTGGTWSPALVSGTGLFDPAVDTAGTYTYTVNSTNVVCPDASATVTVTIVPPPNAGTDGTLDICLGDTTTFDLFNSLGGTPDTGGTWSPALDSGTGLFNPAVDTAGIYTYTVASTSCRPENSAEVIVTTLPALDISDVVITIDNVCEGVDIVVLLEGMTNLQDGDYSITYQISGGSSFTDTVSQTALNGEISLNISTNLFSGTGLHTFTILTFESVNSGCIANLDTVLPEDFVILESDSPEIVEGGNIFCIDDMPTLAELTNSLVNTNGIEWFDSETSMNPLAIETELVDGTTYYASIVNSDGCSSFSRLAVDVILEDCIKELLIPDGFSPNGDSINDTFHIVNLDILYPNFKLTIYNRNGNKLYEGNINSPRWDGTTTTNRLGGGIVPTGVYFYILDFNDGIKASKQGRVYLSR